MRDRRRISAPVDGAPAVVSGSATDRPRSAPATFLDQGDGAASGRSGHPAPGSWEPQIIVGALPRSKRAAEARAGGGARDPKQSKRPARRPRRGRGIAERGLGAARTPANPLLARRQRRLAHGQSSSGVGRGGAGAPFRLGGLGGQPLFGGRRRRSKPNQAKARPTSKSTPSRRM